MDLETESNFQLPPKEEITLYLPLSPMQQFWYLRLIHKLDSAMGEKIFDSKAEEQLEPANQEGKRPSAMSEHLLSDTSQLSRKWWKMLNIRKRSRQALIRR